MMKNITHADIIYAIQYINQHGVPDKNKSKQYNLYYDGKTYPPKYTMLKAIELKNGVPVFSEQLNGGEGKSGVNKVLRDLGFTVI